MAVYGLFNGVVDVICREDNVILADARKCVEHDEETAVLGAYECQHHHDCVEYAQRGGKALYAGGVNQGLLGLAGTVEPNGGGAGHAGGKLADPAEIGHAGQHKNQPPALLHDVHHVVNYPLALNVGFIGIELEYVQAAVNAQHPYGDEEYRKYDKGNEFHVYLATVILSGAKNLRRNDKIK